LLQAYAKFTVSQPDEMSTDCQVLPSEQGPRILIGVGYCGEPSLGNDLLRPLRAPLKPKVDSPKVMSYLEAQSTAFSAGRSKYSYFAMDVFLPELSEAAIAAITTATQDAPPRFWVPIWRFHGAVTRVPSGDTAFALRQRGYDVGVSCSWSAPEEKASAVRWVKALRDKLQPFAHGAYVNSLSETSDELVRTAYGPNYPRLVEIKKKYDPTNVLRLNQNIQPDRA
jgi:hypothetical protein